MTYSQATSKKSRRRGLNSTQFRWNEDSCYAADTKDFTDAFSNKKDCKSKWKMCLDVPISITCSFPVSFPKSTALDGQEKSPWHPRQPGCTEIRNVTYKRLFRKEATKERPSLRSADSGHAKLQKWKTLTSLTGHHPLTNKKIASHRSWMKRKSLNY